MSREIKFRVWVEEQKAYIDDFAIFDIEPLNEYFKSDQMLFEQYTGLKDKNGVEIYEGDIIQYDNDDSMSNWTRGEKALIVSYTYKMVARMFPYDIKQMGNQNILSDEFEDCVEVIGNIHENKELLGDKK